MSSPAFGPTLETTEFINLGVDAANPRDCWMIGVPGASHYAVPPEHLLPEIAELVSRLKLETLRENQSDFAHRSPGGAYRVKKVFTAAGSEILFLRRISGILPSFRNSEFSFPPWLAGLLRQVGKESGIILFTGVHSAGKTTSAVATYLDQIAFRGGVGVAVEDPVEYNLNLSMENGRSVQFDVAGHPRGAEAGYAETCQSAFRMFSTLGYIGEIRSAEVCCEALRFAGGAFTVVTTTHANGPLASIRRLTDMASVQYGIQGAHVAVGNTLLAIVTQELSGNPRSPMFKPLFIKAVGGIVSAEEEAAMRNNIRTGAVGSLQNDIVRQEIRLRELSTQFAGNRRREGQAARC